MKKLPIVALVGQTNAGKSSLLNRLARKNIAIVAREAGTTRDNVIARIDGQFTLIDTAGLKDPNDEFEANIQDQIADAVEVADLILLTLDSTKYPDHRDKAIARTALKSRKPVLLILNKSDCGEALDGAEFLQLGIKPAETVRTSATTGQGIKDLKIAIAQHLGSTSVKSAENVAENAAESATENTAEPPLKIALIGRPNVGKSSLFNSLGQKQQAIVSSRQGTTRDINRINLKFKGRSLEILDTAGLRKPGKREVGIEKFSALRSLAAIEEADVCALLVDATEPHAKLDQSLAGQIVDAGKGIIIVVTKVDLLHQQFEERRKILEAKRREQEAARLALGGLPKLEKPAKKSGKSGQKSGQKSASDPAETEVKLPENPVDALLDDLEYDFNFLPYAPVLITSSATGQNVTKLFDLALEIDATRHQEIKTTELNKILADAIVAHPPAGLKNTKPKPKYIVQTDTCPPWFVVHGHELGLLHWSYKRYLERKIREKFPFVGTPIFFSFYSDDATKQHREAAEQRRWTIKNRRKMPRRKQH